MRSIAGVVVVVSLLGAVGAGGAGGVCRHICCQRQLEDKTWTVATKPS